MIIGVAFCALMVTGCAPAVIDTHPATVASPDPLVAGDSGTTDSLVPVTPATMVSAATARSGLSLPWKFLGFGADRTQVDIEYVKGDGDCTLPIGLHVSEVAGAVELFAISRSTHAHSCADKLEIGHAVVSLPRAVGGGVKLLHAPVAPAWASANFLG